MTKNNPFNSNNYDLGVSDAYGISKDAVSESFIHSSTTHTPSCYVCTTSYPQYKVMAKNDSDNTAQVQNGLYICRHCVSTGVLDPKRYGLREMQ